MQKSRRLVSVKELRERFGIFLSFTHLKRKMFEDSPPTFPLWVKLGRHLNSRVGWWEDDIEEWLASLDTRN